MEAMATAPAYRVGQSKSAVAWSAIIAGAFTAAAASLVLFLLGSGLGLATVSPWRSAGISATAFTIGATAWMVATQWFASALGGYLTGRLRSKWLALDRDEVFFRDTAHGFLAWALATVITAASLTSAITSVANVNPQEQLRQAMRFHSDGMFRMVGVNAPKDIRADANRIFTNAAITGTPVSDQDKEYLAQLVANTANIPMVEANSRVNQAIAQTDMVAKDLATKAEEARKAASTITIITALSMLVGAFIACVSAALGGRHRDEF